MSAKENPPTWAQCMMETVRAENIHRICETTSEDLTPHIPNFLAERWQNMNVL